MLYVEMLSSIELRVLEMNIYSSSNSFSSLSLILVFLSPTSLCRVGQK